MKKNLLVLFIAILALPQFVSTQEKEHPTFSLAFTDEIRADQWFDDYSLDIRVFKNMNNGFAIGGKVGTDLHEKVDFGLALRKSVVKTLFLYGDGGYCLWDKDGLFGEGGVATYFWKNQLGIHLGAKHYFGPGITAMSCGFMVNF